MSNVGPAENPPTTGLVAGKYELVRMIGRGGMGSVWEAKHVSLGTKVAIKFVEVEQAQSEEARSRFQTEARAAATIQSKHAIKVYDHGLLDDGRPYIVMELLVGEPLDKRLDLLVRLPLDDVARLVLQVARALQQAHDSGITHRDLKPENIFIERGPDDEVDMAKVLDFGIAKIKNPVHALGVSSSTKTGVLMGTPFFMSPEQARGLKTVDHRSDLWSLGVIVYRCVTGELPFNGESLGDLLVKICAAPVPVPSHVMPGLTPQFDAWMMRALDRDPTRRFQSASELAESLALVAGLSIRLPSRRTPDVALAYQGTEALPVSRLPSQSWPDGVPARTPDPYMATSPHSPLPPNLEMYRQPPAGVTSAPFTANAAGPTKSTRVGGLVVMAVVLAGASAIGVVAVVKTRATTATVVAQAPPPTPVLAASQAPMLPIPAVNDTVVTSPSAVRLTAAPGAGDLPVLLPGPAASSGGPSTPTTSSAPPGRATKAATAPVSGKLASRASPILTPLTPILSPVPPPSPPPPKPTSAPRPMPGANDPGF